MNIVKMILVPVLYLSQVACADTAIDGENHRYVSLTGLLVIAEYGYFKYSSGEYYEFSFPNEKDREVVFTAMGPSTNTTGECAEISLVGSVYPTTSASGFRKIVTRKILNAKSVACPN